MLISLDTDPLTPDDIKEGDYTYSLTVLDSQFTLYWKMEDNDIIQIAMVANTVGKIGFGVSLTLSKGGLALHSIPNQTE